MSKTQVKSNDRFSKFRMESPLGKFFTILLYVVMTIIVLIVLLPVLHIIAASFSDPQAMISGKVSFWPKDFTLRGYEAVFTYKKFWTGFRNSLFYMVFGTFINIVMTLLCAYPLQEKSLPRAIRLQCSSYSQCISLVVWFQAHACKCTWSCRYHLGNAYSRRNVYIQHDHCKNIYDQLHSR